MDTIKKQEITQTDAEYKKMLKTLINKRADEAEKITRSIEELKPGTSDEELKRALKNINEDADELTRALESVSEVLTEVRAKQQPPKNLQILATSANYKEILESRGEGGNTMAEDLTKETRDFFKKFTEKRTAGDTTSMAEVIPETILGQYVIEKAPGAMYQGASKTNIKHSGDIKLPVAELQDIAEHTENGEITPAGYVPDFVTVTHKEYAYNTGYSALGVDVSVDSFMSIIYNTLLGSMLKKFDKICVDAVGALTFNESNSVEYAHGGSPAFTDFVAVASKLGANFTDGAKWYMSPTTYFNCCVALLDQNGKPIFDPSKKAEENAPLGFAIKLDAQLPTGVIYFGNSARVHFNAAHPAELNRWTDFNKDMEMAGIRAAAGATAEPGAFVRLSEAEA